MPKSTDDEFHFQMDDFGDELTSHETATASKTPTPSPVKSSFSENVKAGVAKLFFNRKVMVAIFIVIAVFVVYHFVLPATSATSPEEKVQLNQAASANLSVPKLENAATSTTKSFDSAVVQTDQMIGGDVSTLQNQVQANQRAIQDLAKNQQQMQALLTKLNTQTQSLSTSVLAMNSALVTKPSKTTRPLANKPLFRPIDQFYLRAIAPGVSDRAWLSDGQNQMLTVIVGDSLRGYGKILAINSVMGTVATSSGKVISYHAQDK